MDSYVKPFVYHIIHPNSNNPYSARHHTFRILKKKIMHRFYQRPLAWRFAIRDKFFTQIIASFISADHPHCEFTAQQKVLQMWTKLGATSFQYDQLKTIPWYGKHHAVISNTCSSSSRKHPETS